MADQQSILARILAFGIPEHLEADGNPHGDAFQTYQFFPDPHVLPISQFTPEQLNEALDRTLRFIGNPNRMTERWRLVIFYSDIERLIELASQPPANDRFIIVGLYLLLRRNDPLGFEIFDRFYLKWSRGWELGIPNDPYLGLGPRWIEYADAIETKVGRVVPKKDCNGVFK